MQRVADFPYRGIDSVVRIQEDAFAPHALEDFLSRNQLSAALSEQEEQLEGDALKVDGATVAPELVGSPVKLKLSETADIHGHFRLSPPARQS